MRLFSSLYRRALQWSVHPHAPIYLGGISFAEASFFPLPPDVMLVPMSLAKPEKAWGYAQLTVITSVLGALLGYGLGYWFFDWIHPTLISLGYEPTYLRASQWFHQWGFWALLLAAFSPIPFKVFTLAAGAIKMPLFPFLIGATLGRVLRFYLVVGLTKRLGPPIAPYMEKYIDRIGWLVVVLALLVYWIVK